MEAQVLEDGLPPISGPSLHEIAAYIPEEGLKQLRPKHLRIISLYMSGRFKRFEIARMEGVTPVTITNVISDPLSQKILQKQHEQFEEDLIAMKPIALDTMRSGLLDKDLRIGLSALDKYFKATGLYKEKADARDSAEDVMQRILNLQVNVKVVSGNESTGESISDISLVTGEQLNVDHKDSEETHNAADSTDL